MSTHGRFKTDKKLSLLVILLSTGNIIKSNYHEDRQVILSYTCKLFNLLGGGKMKWQILSKDKITFLAQEGGGTDNVTIGPAVLYLLNNWSIYI